MIIEKIKMFIVNLLLIFVFLGFLLNIIVHILCLLVKEPNGNNTFFNNDEKIVSEYLNANGKDILIIFDTFAYEKGNYDHGEEVSQKLKSYFKSHILPEPKEMDIKLINLSIDKDKKNIAKRVKLLKDDYTLLIEESYTLELYLKKIKEINPKSKIVISLSFINLFTNNQIIDLSNKYDFKVVQSYLNEINDFRDFISFLIFNFLLNYDNTIFITNQEYKPFNGVKHFDITDFYHVRYMKNTYAFSNSYLTPVLAYEYYLNKKSNFISNKELKKNNKKK